MPTAAPVSASSDLRLRKMLTSVLEKVAGSGVRIVRFYPQGESGLKGIFLQRSDCLVFELNWDKNKLSYKLVTPEIAKKMLGDLDEELSARIAILPLAPSETRTDKADKCVKGVSCGDACIEPGDTCELEGNEFATPGQMAAIKGAAQSRDQKTIRELQEEARQRGVYRANHMSKAELVSTLQAVEKDPESQNRLRKTLDKQQSARRERDAYLGSASATIPGNPLTTWGQLQKITRMLGGATPQIAALTVGAFLINQGVAEYRKGQDRYRDGFQESARMAVQQARRLPVEEVEKDNIMFTVDGFSQAPVAKWADIKSHLAPLEDDSEEDWLTQNNHVIPLKSADFDVPLSSHQKRDASGNYNPAYLFDHAKGQFGKYLSNVKKGRNQAAVDLAAQLYAHGSAYKDKPINILAHGAGGNVTNEALEILERMRPPDGSGIKGSDISSRINVVMMGTPDFGMTKPGVDEKGKTRTTKRMNQNISTITSSKDPFSILPKYRPKWISTVKGGEVEDYLSDPEARRHIRESFGYYDSSLLGRKTKKQESAAEPKPKATRSRAKPVVEPEEEEENYEPRLTASKSKPKATTPRAAKPKPEPTGLYTAPPRKARKAAEPKNPDPATDDDDPWAEPEVKPKKARKKKNPEGGQ